MIIDHGLWRDTREPWGVHIYDEAVRHVPVVFLDEPAYGVHRRPGVIHVPAPLYRRTERRIRERLLHDPRYVRWLRQRCMGDLQQLHQVCGEVESSAGRGLLAADRVAELLRMTIRCKAYMGFNWLLPRDEIAVFLGKLLGEGDEAGHELLLNLSAPDVLPHYTRLHVGLHELAESLAAGVEPDYAAFATHLGFAQGYPLRPQPLEQRESVMAEVRQLCNQHDWSAPQLRAEREALVERAAAARRRRDNLCGELLAALLPSQVNDRARLLATVDLLSLAADEEEERHFVEMRAVRACRLVGVLAGVDVSSIDEIEFLGRLAVSWPPQQEAPHLA